MSRRFTESFYLALSLALHPLPSRDLAIARCAEAGVADRNLAVSLSWNECGAEPSTNSFFPPPSTTGTVKRETA